MCKRKAKVSNDPIGFSNGSEDISVSLAQIICAVIDSPRSLMVHLLIKYGEWDQLVTMEIDAMHYNNVEAFRQDFLVTNVLRKSAHLPTRFDRRRESVNAFLASEEACRLTNLRIIRERNVPKAGLSHSVFHTARRLIADVLGGIQPDLLLEGGGFGPGVSSSVKGVNCSYYHKALGKPEVTSQATELGWLFFNHIHPLSSAYLKADGPASVLKNTMQQVRGNTVTFVPKDAKSFRAIAVEPHVNMLIQKGIGNYIRHRLKRVNINLRDQDRNRELAQIGSRTGTLATIDLSSASDTISIELVRELLPPDWFSLLNTVRSSHGKLDGTWFRYEKFSSSGNGFTFELESLIFWALVKAVCVNQGHVGVISVYGDDIIAPVDSYRDIVEVFTFAGFRVNNRKSFYDSPFRESCGGNYFLGSLVTPFYIRDKIKTVSERFTVHNQLFLYALRSMGGLRLDPRFIGILRRIKGRSSYEVHPHLGDVGFWSLTKPKTAVSAEGGIEGCLVKGLIEVPTKTRMVEYYASLYQSFVTSTDDSPSLGYSPRRGDTRWRAVRILVPDWNDLSKLLLR